MVQVGSLVSPVWPLRGVKGQNGVTQGSGLNNFYSVLLRYVNAIPSGSNIRLMCPIK